MCEIDKKIIAIFHGDDKNINNLIIESQKFDLVCLGHTHVAKIERIGKTLVINPGSLIGYFVGKKSYSTVAVYDTALDNAKIIDLDLEQNI